MSQNQIIINNLSKVYDNGFKALKKINLSINKGEIFAMLGPNGAGKTTLISIICGIVNPSSGNVTVEDFDIIKNYRETRSKIGLVPEIYFKIIISADSSKYNKSGDKSKCEIFFKSIA